MSDISQVLERHILAEVVFDVVDHHVDSRRELAPTLSPVITPG